MRRQAGRAKEASVYLGAFFAWVEGCGYRSSTFHSWSLPSPPTHPPPTPLRPSFAGLQRAYNTILAGAAFMDAHTFFPLYSSDAVAPARALVDQVFNCDGQNGAAAGGAATRWWQQSIKGWA